MKNSLLDYIPKTLQETEFEKRYLCYKTQCPNYQ